MRDKSPTTATLGTPYWFLVAGIPLVAVDVSIMDVLLPDIVAQLNISVADASLVDAVTVGVQTSVRYLICGFAMVVMTTLLISVTAVGVHKVSFTGLSVADRTTLDAVERLKRPGRFPGCSRTRQARRSVRNSSATSRH